ncbi:MAG: hypothetical protein AAFV80_13080, partial [Bacteroidota bacterium]
LALLTYVIYTMILEPIIRYWPHRELFGSGDSMWLYPLNVLEDLVYPDFFKVANVADGMNLVILDPRTAVTLSCVYISIFIVVAFGVLRKQNL